MAPLTHAHTNFRQNGRKWRKSLKTTPVLLEIITARNEQNAGYHAPALQLQGQPHEGSLPPALSCL